MIRRLRTLAFGAGLVVLGGCDAGKRLREMGRTAESPHEQYASGLQQAGLDKSVLGRDWIVAGDSALRVPLDAHHKAE